MRLYFVTVCRLLGNGHMAVLGEGKLFIDAPEVPEECVFRIGDSNVVMAFSALTMEPEAKVLERAEPVFSMESAKKLLLPPAPSAPRRGAARTRKPRRRTRSPR